MASDELQTRAAWRRRAYVIVFESDTFWGRFFDVGLILTIVLSTLVVMLESVAAVGERYGELLRWTEWFLTAAFSVEYVLRLACARNAGRYARSFFGVIDVLAILPTYLSVFLPGAQYLLVIRLLRILRVFRVLKLAHYLKEIDLLVRALRASRRKIAVFLYTVLTLVVVLGSLMYLIEGPAHGFTSIPRSVYWSIVTLTTVGYGDISPQTPAGQALASVVMVLGYGIIAVPTGIVTVELSQVARQQHAARTCGHCGVEGHDADALFCKACGERLDGA